MGSIQCLLRSVSVRTKSNKLDNMNILARLFCLLLVLEVSHGLFFGTPRSSCSRNSQCRSFARRQCLGAEFIFCFGPSRAYTLPGRCVERRNFFCDIGNALGGRGGDCRYNECANCLNSQDCGFDEYCSNSQCIQNNNNNNG